MKTLWALLHRDLRVAQRELKFSILRVALQPLLFTFIFGFVMPKMGTIKAGYTTMLLPGILALSMTLSGMQSVALPLVIDFGWTKEIEDRLLAPISIAGVALEKILMGMIQAIVAGLIVLPLAFFIMGSGLDLHLSHPYLLIAIALLTSLAFLGIWIGSWNGGVPTADRACVQRLTGSYDLFRLRVLSVGRAKRYFVVSEVCFDQPSCLCQRRFSSSVDAATPAYAIMGDFWRADRVFDTFYVSGNEAV